VTARKTTSAVGCARVCHSLLGTNDLPPSTCVPRPVRGATVRAEAAQFCWKSLDLNDILAPTPLVVSRFQEDHQ
jgi:hypothetical protein